MAQNDYAAYVGIVQHFKDKEVQTTREINNQTVIEFTTKSVTRDPNGKQNLVRITLWPEWGDVTVKKGDVIIADGKFNVSEGKNGAVFFGLTPTTMVILPGLQKAAGSQPQVVNATAAASAGPGF